MARYSKLNPDTQKAILDAIAVGATHRIACEYAGISHETLYTWIDKGKKGVQPYADFFDAFIRAQGRTAVAWLAKIEAAANAGDWRAVAWKLERRYPEEYGRSVQDTRTLDYSKLSDRQITRLAAGEAPERVLGDGGS